ncbi:hypothetical protein PoB_004331300 [Plakobranchus ocellatus]|uniref:Uncharacterized protein n=1 Tax=Plakobranchus ocellatus TaxID=259542 RepID=A0AAV4BB61_9GAST|nr:hypothetical protein PoB_004331300 [Plakobranchus ocellatus]
MLQNQTRFGNQTVIFLPIVKIWSIDCTVDSESALRYAGTFCRWFESLYQCPGLTEGLKACDQLVVNWQYTKKKTQKMILQTTVQGRKRRAEKRR